MSMSTTEVADSDLLMDVLHHSEVLTELHGESLTHEELARRLDVSSATCYRYTNHLDELAMVAESGDGVALTALGETIAEEVGTFERTVTETLGGGSDEQEIFEEVLRHSPGLNALSRHPLDRREVEDRLGVSETTGYRITRFLEDRELIEKTDGRYEITATGEEVLEAVSAFESNVRTAVKLGPVLPTLREEGPSIDIDAFAGATVTTRSGYTFSPVNRFLELFQETDTVRCTGVESVFSSFLAGLMEPIYEGVKIEVIKQPETAAEMLTEFPDRAMDICNRTNISVYLHEELWYHLAIFDDRIAIGSLDADTGTCHTLVDTEATAARRWAEAVYEAYKDEAVHLPRFDPFNLQQVVEEKQSDTVQHVEQR